MASSPSVSEMAQSPEMVQSPEMAQSPKMVQRLEMAPSPSETAAIPAGSGVGKDAASSAGVTLQGSSVRVTLQGISAGVTLQRSTGVTLHGVVSSKASARGAESVPKLKGLPEAAERERMIE